MGKETSVGIMKVEQQETLRVHVPKTSFHWQTEN
jgi:hypothetical protein